MTEQNPKLVGWVEENVEETLTYYRLPLAHHKHMKSTNMLERLNQELKRWTHVVRIFPNEQSCFPLVRAVAIETHECESACNIDPVEGGSASKIDPLN